MTVFRIEYVCDEFQCRDEHLDSIRFFSVGIVLLGSGYCLVVKNLTMNKALILITSTTKIPKHDVNSRLRCPKVHIFSEADVSHGRNVTAKDDYGVERIPFPPETLSAEKMCTGTSSLQTLLSSVA